MRGQAAKITGVINLRNDTLFRVVKGKEGQPQLVSAYDFVPPSGLHATGDNVILNGKSAEITKQGVLIK